MKELVLHDIKLITIKCEQELFNLSMKGRQEKIKNHYCYQVKTISFDLYKILTTFQ